MLPRNLYLQLSFLLLLCLLPVAAYPHALAPSLLEIEEAQFVSVIWRTPKKKSDNIVVQPRFPNTCTAMNPPVISELGTSWETQFQLDCGVNGFRGQTITVEGLGEVDTNVVVRYLVEGKQIAEWLLNSDQTSFSIPEEQVESTRFLDYFKLGIGHLLGGADHVAFLVGLLFLIAVGRQLIIAVTAFTLGHSVTLVLSSLELVTVPSQPVEILIALTIMFVAQDVIRKESQSLLQRFPAAMTAFIGLIHGLGFAGVLSEIGLPSEAILPSLFAFNIGIEVGQLMVVGAWISMLFMLKYFNQAYRVQQLEAPIVFCIGSVGGYWLVDRSIQMLVGVAT